MINVLQLTTDSKIGGAEDVILTLAKSLDKRSFNITICCLMGNGPLIDKMKANGIDIRSLGMRNKFDIFGVIKLVSLLREKKTHIIHSHLFHANILGRIVGKLMNVPIVICCEHTMGLEGRHRMFMNKLTSGLSDKIVAISYAVRNYLVKQVGIGASKIITVQNGIDINRYKKIKNVDMRAEFHINENDKIIGIVGRMDKNKGHKYFLLAAKEVLKVYHGVKFIIIGDGPVKKKMEKLADSLGIKNNIIFTGFRNDVLEILNIIDVFVLSSLWEGLPITILEAMLCKKPVIATGVSGIPEVVEDNKTGILVPPKDYISLSNAIVRLLNDKQLAVKMGKEGYERVIEKFDSDRMVNSINDIYKELTKSKLGITL